MATGWIIAGAVTGGLVVLFAILNMVMSTVRKKLENHIHTRFDVKEIIGATTRANFFGLKSKGGRQWRGNGALVLTREQLCFVMAVPERELNIPLASITGTSLPKSFNGRSVFARLLCVHFRDQGREDTVAWAVKEPQKWVEAIETQAGNA